MDRALLKKQSTDNAVEEIKNRLDIIETVSEHIVLKKSGRNYWGLCPFHKEKTPSFSVNAEKGIYKCFGCGEGGDSISFLMKVNNTSFWETMVMLAQKFNIELPEAGVTSESSEYKKQILEINKYAAEFYKKMLLENKEAKNYLLKRGINETIIEEFSLGFAPVSADELIKKYDKDILQKIGLLSFKNRIIIPIQDEKGNFIAFGARAMADSQGPKYLNSPESPVFNKSRSLFGLYQAKDSIKELDSVILMEGYFDVISAHSHGLANVVATLGTALTEQHIRIVARYSESRRIYLAFDSDEAGVNATNRGAEIIKSAFSGLGEIRHFDENFADSTVKQDRTACEIRVITTNTGKDPDEFLREHGAEAYKELINSAPLLIDYQINRIINLNEKISSPQDKAKLGKEVIPLLSEIRNSIIRNEYIKLVAGRLSIDEESLNIEVRKNLQKVTYPQANKNGLLFKNQEEKYVLAQKNLLSLYFLNNEKFAPLCINNYIKEVELSDTHLNLIKKHIDEIIDEFNDSDKLFKELLNKLAENEEAKKVLTDLIYRVEDKKDLNFELLEQYLTDHILYLKTYQVSERQKQLRASYYADNNDDTSSELHQQKVKELISERRL
ncbi:MAG: DNA primase [Candidatus Melainabacteria bacterium GWF2_37_15]|nr:MAG: DNA primase [Candidatus Melainabacteria bacterium GWF2_37_15]